MFIKNINRYFGKMRILTGLVALSFATTILATENPTFGEIATKLNVGSSLVTHFLHFICILIGIGFIIMALSFYKAHRENPKFMPIERPIAYVVLGLVLISVPFLGKFFGAITGSPTDTEQRKAQAIKANRQDIDAPLEPSDED